MTKKENNTLCKMYQGYKKECAKNGVVPREFDSWFHYHQNNLIPAFPDVEAIRAAIN